MALLYQHEKNMLIEMAEDHEKRAVNARRWAPIFDLPFAFSNRPPKSLLIARREREKADILRKAAS